MLSTSSENPESENSGLVEIWVLGPGRQRHQGSGKKQIDYLENPYREKGVGGSFEASPGSS